ncbi:MAG: type IVB secretion system apparatus protein IcmL/DotI [Proteobacteria bacterium]|nr:type IVB secretion system apparatus protein IcmL/DotI [Pseudomonadota bacterium]
MKEDALTLVLFRNLFYRDGYRIAVVALFIVLMINCVLAGILFYQFKNPPQPQFFPITPDGRIINNYRLDDPIFTDDHVLQWTSDAVRQTFSLDFMHWQDQLQVASNKFSQSGWTEFLKALKESNNLDTLTKLKMVSNAEVTGAPRLMQKASLGGRFVWKIQLPILVTLTNSGQIIPVPMDVTVIVIRVPVEENPERIAINNFLPVVQKAQTQ